jgi:hypothetical protein
MVQQPTSSEAAEPQADQAEKAEKKNKSSKRSARSRGVESLFRVTYQNHIALSQLADQKAGMLISINGLIISVLIAVLTPRFAIWSWTYGPALILIAGCLGSLVFAVLGTTPRLNRTPVTVEQIRNNQGNVLFFGQFMSMSLPDFQESLRILGKDNRLLRDNLARQLYAMGGSLTTKYRYLQIAYLVFLATLVVATVAFAGVFLALPR